MRGTVRFGLYHTGANDAGLGTLLCINEATLADNEKSPGFRGSSKFKWCG